MFGKKKKNGLYTEISYNPKTKRVFLGFGRKDGKVDTKFEFSKENFKYWLERVNNFTKNIQ